MALRRLKKTLLYLSLFLVSFSICEVSLRVYDYFFPSYLFAKPDSPRRHPMPHSEDYEGFRFNSGGYRDLEFEPKRPGTYRIAFIGDSFVFGIVPYKDNFTTLMEKLLSPAGRTDVLNMGVPSTDVGIYLRTVRRKTFSLKPDLVVIGFFTGNDFIERILGQERPRCYLFRLLWRAWRLRSAMKPEMHPFRNYNDSAHPHINDAAYLGIESHRAKIYLTRFKRQLDRNLDYVLGLLRSMKAACDREGVDFIVCIFPDEVQVDPALRSAVQDILTRQSLTPRTKVLDAEWDNTIPNRKLAEALKGSNIDVVDLTDDFIRESAKTRLYRKNDTHWNLAGNRLAAERISHALKERGYYSE